MWFVKEGTLYKPGNKNYYCYYYFVTALYERRFFSLHSQKHVQRRTRSCSELLEMSLKYSHFHK
jgi:hypothetical protein